MSVKYKDYYSVLGIPKTANESEIKSAFRKLAMKYHPDRNPGNKTAEKKFKEINEANNVLSDSKKRKLYDQLGPNWQDGENFRPPHGGGFRYAQSSNFGGENFGQFEGFSDFFKTIFGAADFRRGGSSGGWDSNSFEFNSARYPRNLDIEATLPISIEDLMNNGEKILKFQNKTIRVKIPKGVKNGGKIRLRGQGKRIGNRTGNLYLKIEIKPSPLFKINGNDLETIVKITPWDAALGAEIKVPSPKGTIKIKIPSGSHSERKLRIAGKGLPKKDGSVGNLFAKLIIDLPENLSPRQIDLLKKLKETS